MKSIHAFILVLIVLTGCRQHIPEPETSAAELTKESFAADEKSFTVRHFVQGRAVLVECFVPGITFAAGGQGQKHGKILVYADGRLFGEFETAAFILKGLEKGSHRIKVEIVTVQNRKTGFSKEFEATI